MCSSEHVASSEGLRAVLNNAPLRDQVFTSCLAVKPALPSIAILSVLDQEITKPSKTPDLSRFGKDLLSSFI